MATQRNIRCSAAPQASSLTNLTHLRQKCTPLLTHALIPARIRTARHRHLYPCLLRELRAPSPSPHTTVTLGVTRAIIRSLCHSTRLRGSCRRRQRRRVQDAASRGSSYTGMRMMCRRMEKKMRSWNFRLSTLTGFMGVVVLRRLTRSRIVCLRPRSVNIHIRHDNPLFFSLWITFCAFALLNCIHSRLLYYWEFPILLFA